MVFMLSSLAAFSANGWWSDYVLINLNGAGTSGGSSGIGYYWIGSDPSYGTQLQGINFGTVSSLVIDGCDMRYWDDTKTRAGGAFYYMIKSADNSTEIVPATEVIWTQTASGDHDYQGTKYGANIDLLAFSAIHSNTTYTLHIWAKTWDGVSSSGDMWLNNGGSNYVATFTTGTIVHTGVSKLESSLQLSGANGKVTARFDGSAQVELFNVSGQLMRSSYVSNEFSQNVQQGAYLLRINGKTHKVLVR
jgi:hypothetical protein